MFANLLSTLILSLDQQFVNILFDSETYAIYAFAYNMLSLITVATSAFATVLYPSLKRTNENSLKQKYTEIMELLQIFVSLTLVVYFPLNTFIHVFLPQYIESLYIFRIVLPGLIMSTSVTVVMHNYYKILGMNFLFFRKSIIILFLSAFANGVAYLIFKTPASISAASIITIIIWYLYAEDYFVKEYSVNRWKNLSFSFNIMLIFYISSYISNIIVGGIFFIALYCLFVSLYYRKRILYMVRKWKRRV